MDPLWHGDEQAETAGEEAWDQTVLLLHQQPQRQAHPTFLKEAVQGFTEHAWDRIPNRNPFTSL